MLDNSRLDKFHEGKINILMDIDSLFYISATKGLEEREIEHMIYCEVFNLQKANNYMVDTVLQFEDSNTNVILYAENPNREDSEGRPMRNFRKLINPEYKAKRKQQKPPRGLEMLQNFYCGRNSVHHPEWFLETDDMIAFDYTLATRKGYNCSIVGIDKDYKQIADVFPYHIDNDFLPYDTQFVYRQCLMGDASDGIKGIPKVGPAISHKFLTACAGMTTRDMEKALVKRFCNNEVVDSLIRDYVCLKLVTPDQIVDDVWIYYNAFGHDIYVNVETGELQYKLDKEEREDALRA